MKTFLKEYSAQDKLQFLPKNKFAIKILCFLLQKEYADMALF